MEAKSDYHSGDVQRQGFHKLKKTTWLQYSTCQQRCYTNWCHRDHHINLQKQLRIQSFAIKWIIHISLNAIALRFHSRISCRGEYEKNKWGLTIFRKTSFKSSKLRIRCSALSPASSSKFQWASYAKADSSFVLNHSNSHFKQQSHSKSFLDSWTEI